MLQTQSSPAKPVIFISEGESFRESLTPKEALVYDAVMNAGGRKSKKQIGEDLGMSQSSVTRLYWQAHAKHLAAANRSTGGR